MNYKLELTQPEVDYLGNLLNRQAIGDALGIFQKLLASVQARDAAAKADAAMLEKAKADAAAVPQAVTAPVAADPQPVADVRV